MNTYEHTKKTGWIEVICGSMFSGKTEELLRRIRRAFIAHQKVQIFKPLIDKRYKAGEVISHDQRGFPSYVVASSQDITANLMSDAQLVAIDEAQFFDVGIVEVCQQLADQGIRVIVAGLDTDYRYQPFGPMPQLMAIAEFVTKNQAICVCCGGAASRTYRLSTSTQQIEVGGSESYEARCRTCSKMPTSSCPLPRPTAETMAVMAK